MQLIKLLSLFNISILFIGCSVTQYYYIENAALDNSVEGEKGFLIENRKEPAKLLLNGHFIKKGENLVLLIRRFNQGSILAIDDETYEKATIELKSYKVGVPIMIQSPGTKIYYSFGSSGFVKKGHGVFSDSGSGTITIRRIEKNKIMADLDISIIGKPAGAFPFDEKRVEIKDALVFEEKKFADLTPWLGSADPSIEKQVYP